MAKQKADRPTWAADKIEFRAIASLTPDPGNARTHSPEQIGVLRASLREFGWTTPVIIRANGRLIAGHGRREAALLEVEAGNASLQDAPCVVCPDWWTEDQIRAYVIADNRTAELAGWDFDVLKVELAGLESSSL